ncbi:MULTISPECIES: 16S rRNA (adenine(1518)-N(6)/adenine(1519)-N(6))-dimethyltransferase RsmA [unclassified Campylobacter]|uniref:16S rRNA (adenine(1518)-N(6)/adenine(1519)-N(6))- dimethyltransferase RsmA n=1 Tax=unclassified Campylobacter TaxID=2593542 RepID=UPI0022E9FA8E|nr:MULTISPECIES: 16S rRNA (adenine(1518)-N(6)/adenine(1519)-N(6))-dimethyltransferase RsmA [unclassified Campylobacter]MDA3043848.1 16S rRNA (adenine(1518)-N(6)/adenine(1519)-N(6))-dimethyltransferase RsmA [Campylobacter sp. JMF_09 ED2]MDA3043997.1 16S rRNA (adenine(1518)-N(6)/adenine(1519)-N(6))-dimethyltransferase RsmA [Campylobacter sp. JMF_07 ED4]MDA3064068.1 16S rRNA (adenine(1518)-N(6)/adenine(1519)-N(6))-dimethyltransferase RsmA [Campylobacter sp. JMF_11 EL3]MDA3072332.1 16S rRNA (adenin
MIVAKKKFGQNFLKDSLILDKIIQSIPKNAENIVEIGPGLGDLTRNLLKSYKVKSFEIDNDLYRILCQSFATEIKNRDLELVLGDVLEIWENSLSEKPYFLVANLPYYIATNIILRAIEDPLCEGLVVMVQKEVAQKFCAVSGKREFGAISVLASLCGGAQYLFEVPPHAFEPAPKVISAVMRIEKTRNPFQSVEQKREFEAFLRVCFASPRKTLAKNLSAIAPKSDITQIFEELEIFENTRPHELNFALFLDIFKKLKVKNGREKN